MLRGLVALALLAIPCLASADPLPRVVEITVPGAVVKLPLEADFCGYPPEARKRLADYLAGGGETLLGAAGDCGDIDRLSRTGSAIVSRFTQIATPEDQMDPTKRLTKPAFLRACFEAFPVSAEDKNLRDALTALGKIEGGPTANETLALGRLRATRDAVFGGLVLDMTRGTDRIWVLQVIACFAPAGVPLSWTFGRSVTPGLGAEAFRGEVDALLSTALAAVASTVELNRE